MALTKRLPPTQMWLYHAMEDYASSRCLLLNAMPGGFMLAQQALEKLLKAYLCHGHPGRTKFVGGSGALVPKVLDVHAGHDLVAHYRLALATFPNLAITNEQLQLLENLSYCFEGKYPDVQTPLTSKTTAWVHEIDRVFVPWAVGLPLPDEIRWRTGLHTCVWSEVMNGVTSRPHDRWVRAHNQAFADVHAELCATVSAGSAERRRAS